MKESTSKSVADSLEVNENILAHMPYLLQDLWALGSSVEEIIKLLTDLNRTTNIYKVLDLGCGKGALSVKIASKFGFKVTGIDAMKDFLSEARKKAEEFNVSDNCNFVEKDILEFTKTAHNYDLVILASLGGVFGTNIDTVYALRSQVKSGGYILIDDGFIKKGNELNRKGYEHYRTFDISIQELTSFGDKIISTISTTVESKEINEFYVKNLKQRITELSVRYPDSKHYLHNYYSQQIDECDYLDEFIDGIIWLIKKTGP